MSDTDSGTLLLQCIARLAWADGRVTDGEVTAIRELVHELTGMAPEADLIRAMMRDGDVGAHDGDPIVFIRHAARDEPLDIRLLIARAGYRVLASDGEITGSEVETFNALLSALDLTPAQVMRLLD